MTPLDNSFLLSKTVGVDVQRPDPLTWVFGIEKNGELDVSFLQFDANLSVLINLNGEGAKCSVNCAYLLNKNSKLNIDIKVLHNAKKTNSKQQIKGLVTDFAELDFNGQIVIPHASQQCDGMQSHRGILLSDKAVISATPQLEIWADDVKCSHGSAVGPLSEEEIFYLQTRGLTENEAKKLLLSSFFSGIIPEDFDPKIQQWMDENV